jgi:alginate O-acetyltransferase complex protein AlgI
MLFNSIEFIFFFPIVFIIYFSIASKYRWALLLAASYYFYASWKLEYIILIIFSTCVDYFLALRIHHATKQKTKKRYLILSLVSNLSLLFGFKYFNFFSGEVQTVLNNCNIFYDSPSFKILLPVGISFYTFQTLSYTIDVYKNKIQPEKHFGLFALYVSFFPQLVAGPIERPGNLLPQLKKKKNFNYSNFSSGAKLVIWGFFKKVVIADRISEYVNIVYDNPEAYFGFPVVIATVLFAFQIFCDFSGYTDIAIGISKMMGYDLMQNFNRPYSSKSIKEFWSRWHISLSTWFRDYLYIPLGGNKVSRRRNYYNILITFIISGLWHGSNWTFLIWGLIHGVFLLLENFINVALTKVAFYKRHTDTLIFRIVKKIIIFLLVSFAWVFFRSNNLDDAFTIINNTFIFNDSSIFLTSKTNLTLSALFILFMEIVHYNIGHSNFVAYFGGKSILVRNIFFSILICLIIFFGVYKEAEFIYFQF